MPSARETPRVPAAYTRKRSIASPKLISATRRQRAWPSWVRVKKIPRSFWRKFRRRRRFVRLTSRYQLLRRTVGRAHRRFARLRSMLLRNRNKNAYFATSRSEEHTSELQSQSNLVCRLLLE